MSRQLVSSHTPGEHLAQFSRAVRVGRHVLVSGTTATDEHGDAQHPEDAAAQARYVLRKVEWALSEAGASMADVTRTRIFIRRLEDADAVARVHAEYFSHTRPANTLLRGEPIDPDMLVEIEVDAIVDDV